MPDAIVHRPAQPAFSTRMEQLALELLSPLKPVTEAVRRTQKFKQIATSVREIGVVEPLVVAPDRKNVGRFIVLDGNIRLEVLRESGETSTLCLIANDDEGYTYNNRINRLAIIQEHRMIMTAIQRGVPEERLARALNLNISSIRSRRRLLDGICPEAANLLRDKHVPINAFREFRRMRPARQVEAAELMVAMNRYTVSYARSLLAATPENQLVEDKKKKLAGLTPEQIEKMETESANLQREFRLIEQDYGADNLDLVLATGYVGRLLGNAPVVRYLAQFHPEILAEFQKLCELRQAA
jgi:hypothetical protein